MATTGDHRLAHDEKNFWCDWAEYVTKSEEEIDKDLASLKKEHKSFSFLEDFLHNTFDIPHKLSHVIMLHLPIRVDQKNELIAHFDTVPLTKKAIAEIQARSRENISRFINITRMWCVHS